MPLTAQSRRLLDRFEELGAKPYGEMGVLEARAVVAASMRLQGEPQDIDQVSEVLAPGGAGEAPASYPCACITLRASSGCRCSSTSTGCAVQCRRDAVVGRLLLADEG